MVLKNILEYLRSRKGKANYAVPKLWIPPWYDGEIREIDGRYLVDPFSFYASIIEKLLKRTVESVDYSKSISEIRGETGRDWVKSANLYTLFLRPTTSYNHKGFGRFEQDDVLGFRESGTFLKGIALLPYLRNLDVNAIYLLPVSRYSDIFRKGELGSPYAVKNPLALDERYHDPILEGFTVEDEFKAFVQACHIMDIRVLLDFIPRTASRDSDLITSHPDWFYWISVEELASYGPPKIPNLGFKIPDESDLEYIYSLDNVKEHLKKFSFDPRTLDPDKWDKIVNSTGGNILSEIVKEYGIITPPGFSDWINDPQPTWDDVTFLRLYMDHPKAARKFVSEDQPPYILFDVIKASMFPGEKPNTELWEYVASTIPSYQRRFGLDGARLDMGHALPKELERMIMDRARELDPGFVFIAEELDVSQDERAKESGYDAIIGNSWWMLPRVPEKAYEFYQDIAPNLALPFLASAETPDTPRIRARDKGEKLKKLVPFLMAFAPNGIYSLNSGQEIGEIQPLNLGLDNSDEGRAVLPPSDEFFGKLGFFDNYAYHWDEPDLEVFDFLKNLAIIRGIYKQLMISGEYRPVWLDWQDGKTANASFWKDGKAIIVLGNLDENPRTLKVNLDKTAEKEVIARRLRIWNGKWTNAENDGPWVEIELEGFGFALLEIFEEV